MRRCEQIPGLSVLAHGESVWSFYKELENHILNDDLLKRKWRLPEWIRDKRLWKSQLPLDIVREYTIHHDCGKPYCREVDSNGKQHFPDHAEWSAKVWREAGGSLQAARLMAMDMDIHLMKAQGVHEFSERLEWATLLVVGLCEVHSNAQMFGGIDSDNFKIKLKQISRRGKALLK